MILIDICSSCSDDAHFNQSSHEQRAFSHHIPVRTWDLCDTVADLAVDHLPVAESSMSACNGPAPSEVTMWNVPLTLPPLET